MEDLSIFGDWKDSKTFIFKDNPTNKGQLPEQIRLFSNQIERLSTEYNSITSLPSWLDEFSVLKELKISGSNIQNLSIIKSIPNLRLLKLKHCYSMDFDFLSEIIERLFALHIDTINNKDISFLQKGKELIELELDGCDGDLSFIEDLVKIKFLKINISHTGTFPKLYLLPDLVSLEVNNEYGDKYNKGMDDQFANSISHTINKCTKIKYLEANANIASNIDFSNFTNLIDLRVSMGDLNEIPKSILNLRQLQYLLLEHCNIREIPENIDSLECLEVLSLFDNRISSIPDTILKLHKLRQLNIINNKIKHIPQEIALMPNLQKFDFHNNPISEDSLFYNYNLIGVFKILQQKKNENISIVFLTIPEIIRSAVQEYLIYFDEYYEGISGNKIGFNVSKHPNGLKIEFDIDNELNIEDIQQSLYKYTQHIKTKNYDIEDEIKIQRLEKEVEFMKLKLETKVNHYEQSMRIINAEMRMLESDNEWLKSLTLTLASRNTSLVVHQANENQNHSKLLNHNNLKAKSEITNNISIDVFKEIYDILEKTTGSQDDELLEAITEAQVATDSKKRSHIGNALSKLANVLTNSIDKAHLLLVDMPEVLDKLKKALITAKNVADTGHYSEVAKLINNIIHMI